MAHGRSPSWAIPVHAILSVEQTKKKNKKGNIFFPLSVFFSKQESGLRRGGGLCASRAAVWLGVCCVACALLRARSLAARLAQPNKTFLKKRKKHCVFFNF